MHLHTELEPVQEKIISRNFERVGNFFIGRDLHPMLDCASAPELALTTDRVQAPISADVPLQISIPVKLREEFFGGILFDRVGHAHYMVDGQAFEVLLRLVERRTTLRELSDGGVVGGELRSAAEALVARGIVGTEAPREAPEYYPARDLTLPYLQSPIIVEVEVTYGCFRACRHCAYESSPQAASPDELGVSEWTRVFERLAQHGVLIVQLTGGDPLFREDSFEIVEAADAAGLSVYVRSDTAALSRSSVDRLAALRRLWHVGTSIDGAEAADHDWMRGRGAFEVLCDRVGTLAARGIDVSAGATLHTGNVDTVRDIGRRARAIGARWFDVGFLSPVGRAASMQDHVLDGDGVRRGLGRYLEGVAAGDYEPSHAHYVRRAGRTDPFADLEDLVDDLPYVTEWPFSRLRLDPRGSSYTAGKLKGSDYAGGFDLLTSDLPRVWDDSPNLVALRRFGDGGRIHGLDYRLLRSDHEFVS